MLTAHFHSLLCILRALSVMAHLRQDAKRRRGQGSRLSQTRCEIAHNIACFAIHLGEPPSESTLDHNVTIDRKLTWSALRYANRGCLHLAFTNRADPHPHRHPSPPRPNLPGLPDHLHALRPLQHHPNALHPAVGRLRGRRQQALRVPPLVRGVVRRALHRWALWWGQDGGRARTRSDAGRDGARLDEHAQRL